MKKGVVLYHSNITNIYKERWIKKSVDSILNQTDNNFYIYEVNYGQENYSVLPYNYDKPKFFWKENLLNYAEAMNFIITKAFEDGCDLVFNTNLDDYYHSDRIEIQSKVITNGNYDIVSSDFCYIEETEDEKDEITKYMNMWQYKDYIKENLLAGHNVIAHPSVCYSKNFWKFNKYDIFKTPAEDLDLWQKTIIKGFKFFIASEILLYYRIHKKQSSRK